MEVSAHHYNARMTARKLRPYRAVIKGLSVREADAQLQFMAGNGPKLIRQVLRSAVANAEHNFEIASADLVVSDMIVDSAFPMKRFRPVSRGMANPYVKRTAHITVIVEEAGENKATPRKSRRSEIEEVSIEELTARQNTTPSEPVADIKDSKDKGAAVATKTKEMETMQKVKMQQQGGDAHKTHRRKSLGD